MTRGRILKLAGGALLGLIVLDVVATAATLALGIGMFRR